MSTDKESLASEARWSRLRQDIGVVLWSSFLSACLASLLFFGYFDPALLSFDERPPSWLADRIAGYTIGFFFFWFITAVSGMLVAYLIDSAAEVERIAANGKGRESTSRHA